MSRDSRMKSHYVRLHLTDLGWQGSCACGWRTSQATRQLRDQDVDAHQLGGDELDYITEREEVTI